MKRSLLDTKKDEIMRHVTSNGVIPENRLSQVRWDGDARNNTLRRVLSIEQYQSLLSALENDGKIERFIHQTEPMDGYKFPPTAYIRLAQPTGE